MASTSASACSTRAPVDSNGESVGNAAEALAIASSPPGGLAVSQVPQFVSVTFDDNFNTEGMDWATSFFRTLRNPNGSGNPGTFDGALVRTTFPCNSVYLGGMQASWQTAVNDGHEIANHTVNHGDGIAYSTDQWQQEVANCSAQLLSGLSNQSPAVVLKGFRSPYLHYDDNLFGVLLANHLSYDSSIMNCWADGQDGTNCSWPYTLDSGSADANAIVSKWSGRNVVPVGAHAGLWEMPVAVVFVPGDALAAQYGFAPGLRERIQNLLGGAQNPNFFEQSTGKMVGMDITMVLDGRMTKAEALATLEYTLDLHRAGNRAPMIFVAHTHVYASNWDGNAPGVPNTVDRRNIIQEFVTYALSKPEVRMRPLADVMAWMKSPVPLGSCVPTTCSALGKNCGTVANGCGGTLNCGSCASGQTCSASNICQAACVPTTCSALGKNCGTVANGCGGTLNCGSCATGQTCNTNNVCQTPTCTPTTCAAAGKTCGSLSDGCGGTLNCGSCAAGQTCSTSNVCQSTTGSCTPSVSSYSLGKCNATAVYNGKEYTCISQATGVNGEPTGCGQTGVYCGSIPPDNAAWGSAAWRFVQNCP